MSSHQPGWPDWPAYLNEFCLGFIWEISARFPRQGKAKDPGDESWCQIRETKQTTFAPIIASATLTAVSLQLWCSLWCGKYEGNARQCHPERKNSSSLYPCNRAEVTLGARRFSRSVSGFCQGFAARVNDLRSTKPFVVREKKPALVPRVGWSIHMAKFPARLPGSREQSQPALSYIHIENFTKYLEVGRRDLGNRDSPLVNWSNVKRPIDRRHQDWGTSKKSAERRRKAQVVAIWNE